ncbi:hypothetical protein FDECE_17255 [Fusarium decemcellulare]|nr:hypothetical protein FDECE_17255 [Fusarium decemcellulare]
MFGGGESSSPSNDADFPSEVRYEDCVNAQYILITQHFELKSLDLVLGSSMGAQQAWYWAAIHGTSPEPFLKRIAAIVGSAQTSPHCIAFLEGPTQAMLSAADYSDRPEGTISDRPLIPVHAFAASFCAWTTSPEWYRQEQWRCLGYGSLWDYLRLTSQTLFAGWHPHDLICLVRMWQHGDIATLHPPTDLVTRLSSIESQVLVIPSRTDQYFVQDDCAEEARHLKKGRLVILDTVWGHIGGGGASQDDVEFLDGCISKFLHSTVD